MYSDAQKSHESAAVQLGALIRSARKAAGYTIASLAEKVGRPREWLNRIELGYSELGEYHPASTTDIRVLHRYLEGSFTVSLPELLALTDEAQDEFQRYRSNQQEKKANHGKLTQTEIIMGEEQIVAAIVDLINLQHSDAIIRNTGIKGHGNYNQLPPAWTPYRHALGDFLEKNPCAVFKRIEYASNPAQLVHAKMADEKLAGNRALENVHNAKVKFMLHNPLQLHAIIGQREAIIALPQTSGQAGSNLALLIRDKVFVEALRVWYDEVLWNTPIDATNIDYPNFDDSFAAVKNMYGFSD